MPMSVSRKHASVFRKVKVCTCAEEQDLDAELPSRLRARTKQLQIVEHATLRHPDLGYGFWGLGFGVWGLGIRGLGFGVWGLGSEVRGLGFGDNESGFKA